MNNTDLKRIAINLVSAKIAANEEVRLEWATHQLIQSQGVITGPGVPFYELCARENVLRVIKATIDIYDRTSEKDEVAPQLILNGFEYLHVAYPVERDGERVLVPIDSLSIAELLQRAAEFDKQAEGIKAHAEELRRYVAERNARTSATGQ